MLTYTALMLIPAAASALMLAVAREVIPLFVEPGERAPKRKHKRRRRIRLQARA